MKCKKCGSEHIVKNGKGKWGQIFLCRNCKHQFTNEFGRRNIQDERIAISLYCYGLSLKTIGEMMLVNYSTVYRWIKEFAIVHYEKPVPKSEIIIAFDEMWHFIGSKKTSYGSGKHTVVQPESLLTRNAVIEIPKLLKGCITE